MKKLLLSVRNLLCAPDLKSSLLPFVTVIVLISAGVYANTLVNDFVYDDRSQVLENRFILDFRYLPDIFTKSAWSFQSAPVVSNYYRPMMNVIYMPSYYIFGLTSWGFHLGNILFHAGNSILVLLLARRLFADKPARLQAEKLTSEQVCRPDAVLPLTSTFLAPPFLAALLFAVHPIHTEAVAWVAAVPELSFTLFYLFIHRIRCCIQ
jgi:hypothetical protein